LIQDVAGPLQFTYGVILSHTGPRVVLVVMLQTQPNKVIFRAVARVVIDMGDLTLSLFCIVV
jgi:hypothetical protein